MNYNTQAWLQQRPATSLQRTRQKISVAAATLSCKEPGGESLRFAAADSMYGTFAGLSANFINGPWQIDFWIKPDQSVTGSAENCFVISRSFNSSTPSGISFQVKINDVGQVVFITASSGGAARTKTSSEKINRDEWNHVGVQWKASGGNEYMNIFVNGVKQENKFVSANTTLGFLAGVLSNVYMLGNLTGSSEVFPLGFNLDELRLWSAWKDDDYFYDVAPNFKRLSSESNLLAYWKFNDTIISVVSGALTFSNFVGTSYSADNFPYLISPESLLLARASLSGIGKPFSLVYPFVVDGDYSIAISWGDVNNFTRKWLKKSEALRYLGDNDKYRGEVIDYSTAFLELWNDFKVTSLSSTAFVLETSILQKVLDLTGTVDTSTTISVTPDSNLSATLPTLPYVFNAANSDIV